MASLDDFLDFLPLYPDETEEAIRARWEEWANEGTSVEDAERWTDVREGSFFYITTAPAIRESAREYDLMGTEVPMAAFVLWAWGEYLDDHGVTYDLERLPATAAEGTVRFTGTAGTTIPLGTRVSVEPVDVAAPAPEYEVSVAGVIGGEGTVDLPVVATVAGEIGNVSAGAVTIVSNLTGVTVENLAPMVGGTEAQDDEAFRSRLLATARGIGGANVRWYEQTALEQPGVGLVSVIPLFAGPGTVLVVVATAEGDPVAQSVVDELQRTLDPPAFETTLTAGETLPAATIEVASTVGARPDADGHVRIGDNIVSYTDFDADSFNGAAGGTGTFPAGTKVTQSGRGGGLAPPGHVVLVKTATALNVTVAATLEFEEGYSLDGDGGTIALRDAIEGAIRGYVESVLPGGEIVRNKIVRAITQFDGVHDTTAPTINGGGNLAVPGYPAPQVPNVTTVTLTAGSAP